ncbi:MAG: cyclic pyranopterin monophosphate synthase MoaC [Peptoniphilaceae bacterium]
MELNHFDDKGNARMVDVSKKNISKRLAIAGGKIYLSQKAYEMVKNKNISKGDVLTVAQVAGIMGVKKTPDLIPMTHPLSIDGVDLNFTLNDEEFYIEAECRVSINDRTGVEIEAISGVSIALITIYDMVKAVDKSMVISDIKLKYKSGGKSGEYKIK